ncbi:DUF4260 domain-containing protein [Pseudooctadecabacter sp.]|uniref:DUF4260 domain-containing protein n=1 Tax=Pseudooctadecabacter sp. TaxID=1966338 RepID=UPI0035C841FC
MSTVTWQRLEGGIVLLAGLSVFVVTGSGFAWWAAVLWFFAPDLSFAAYALGNRIGSYVYNAVHIYGFGAIVMAAGLWTDSQVFAGLGALWLAHSGFDRLLGYGLKEESGFSDTHLGKVGKP